MKSDYTTLPPDMAWQPLPENTFGEAEARHLLNRMSFSATPTAVENAQRTGMVKTVQTLLGKPLSMPEPEPFSDLKTQAEENFEDYRNAEEETKRMMRQQQQRDQRSAQADFMIKWLQFAREPQHQAYEKWVLFLQDVFVVGSPKLKNPIEMYEHQEILRSHGHAAYGDLCKAVSRSPGMIRYLDLNKNSKQNPNENFARELFELFMLGEGNYTEADIKEAAKAFTGYRTTRAGKFYLNKKFHDNGEKTVFGKTGKFEGDDIIDLAMQQPAARTYLPSQLIAYYLTAEEALQPAYLEQLGEHWAFSDFNLRALTARFFTSRMFYHPQFRANYIKSPIHLYLGMLTDLNLDVMPFPGRVNNLLRSMGQQFFAPPNVRGWQYGKHWINSTTLAARRNLVQRHFYELDESKLNADEYVELMAARAEGHGQISVTDQRIAQLVDKTPEQIVDSLIDYFYAASVPESYRAVLVNYMKEKTPGIKERIRRITITMLQSPEYQLC